MTFVTDCYPLQPDTGLNLLGQRDGPHLELALGIEGGNPSQSLAGVRNPTRDVEGIPARIRLVDMDYRAGRVNTLRYTLDDG